MTTYGYSYVRFSSKKQGKGDSFRRQTEDTCAGESPASWCARHGVILDTSLTFHDKGVSGYRGKNTQQAGKNGKQGALRAFLDRIKDGTVRPGSYLLVERLDRISRQGVKLGMRLLEQILEAGVKIVTLCNGRVFGPEAVEGLMKGRLELELLLEQAQQYSEALSKRVLSAWEKRRQNARKGEKHLTKNPPGWLSYVDGKFVAIPERVATVQRIFDLAIAGQGVASIVKTLTDEGVPPLGRKTFWNKTLVHQILTTRHVLGERQPHLRVWDGATASRKSDGGTVLHDYPVVISEDDWHRAQAALASRKAKAGRPAKGRVNPFSGLLRDARTQGTCMLKLVQTYGGKSYHVIIPSDSSQGRSGGVSFPFDTFQRCILAELQEIDPREILPPSDVPDETLALSEELSAVNARIARYEQELEDGDDPSILKVVRSLNVKKKDVADRLALARQKTANPLSQCWGEFKSLLDALQAAPDQADAHVRLRAALSRVVDCIWILTAGVAGSMVRYALVDVQFKDGPTRHYLIYHRPARSNGKASKPEQTLCTSFVVESTNCHLSRPSYVAAIQDRIPEYVRDEMPDFIPE
jgi:DNA invertase Pin-like site-specific DNA recombinase